MKWFIDLGSHLFESIELFSRLVPDIEHWNVISLEPAYDSDSKEHIDSFLESNELVKKFASFSFLPLAVSTYTGIAHFKRDYSYPLSGSSSLIQHKPLHKYSTIILPCIDILSLINFTRPSDTVLVKMDIEGSEYAIVDRLASSGLLSRVSSLFIELHEYKLHRDINLDYTLLQQVRSHNVQLFEWESQNLSFASTFLDLKRIDEDYIQALYE